MRAGPAAALLLLASCGGAFDDGVRAYEEGRYEDAHAAFAALSDAAPEVAYNQALCALRAGLFEDAEAAAARLARAADLEMAARGCFLAGNVAFARATRAAAQARGAEAEPFAFAVAIRHAEEAARAFGRAAVTRDDWPAARRNVGRAQRLAERLREEQREAARQRERRTAGGGARVRPVPVAAGDAPDDAGTPPTEAPPEAGDDGDDGAPGALAGVTETDLTLAQVRGLIERLAAKEREKRGARRARRRVTQSGVEKDW